MSVPSTGGTVALRATSRKRQVEAETAFQQGITAGAAGNHRLAADLFSRAVQLAPKWVAPREAAAIALLDQGRAADALSVLFSSLRLRPVPASMVRLLCTVLGRHPVRSIDGLRFEDVSAALALESVDAQRIVSVALRHLKVNGAFGGAIAIGRREGWRAGAAAFLAGMTDGGTRKLPPETELLHRCLAHGLVDDAEIEMLLTEVRRHLLESDPAFLDVPATSGLLAAMARQCWRNEHVWSFTEQEETAAEALEVDVVALLAGARAEGIKLLLRALYFPADRTLGIGLPTAKLSAVRPRAAAAFAAETLSERAAIRSKSATIRTVGGPATPVSSAVARQYEENPYPRWIEANPVVPGAIRRVLTGMLPEHDWPFPAKTESVLVAGCGTGREAVTTHAEFGGTARITAIDLSGESLSYAALKAERSGAGDIEFIKMDLLNLPELGRTFDIVRSCGVLHHMTDPIAGWEMLCRHLGECGLMNVALYSEAARAPLDRLLAGEPLGAGDAESTIRSARQAFLSRLTARDTAADPVWIPIDYWNLSGCRDLLFHAKEHRFTLPEIATALERLKLEFLGFMFTAEDWRQIEARRPGITRSIDLGAWREYEQAYPETFAAMYNFWCRKPRT
jgi:SAM-dependent methyltransferase